MGNTTRMERWANCLEQAKGVKDSCPIQMAEHAIENKISGLPAFRWWIPCVMKKRDRIIAKTKTCYWAKTHKHGFEVPKNCADCARIDEDNKDTLWQDSVKAEMKTVRPAFESHEGEAKDLIGHQHIGVQFAFDIKLGEAFRRKATGPKLHQL